MDYLNNFNKNLEEFIDNLSNMKYELDQNYIFPLEGDKYILDYIDNCKDKGFDISTKNEIIFSENSKIINGINFYQLWNDDSIEDSQKNIIWKYLHILYINSYSYEHNLNVKSILNKYKNYELDSDELDERTKTVLNIIEFMKQNMDENTEIDNIKIDADEDESNNSNFPNIMNQSPEINTLLDSEIGNLAKEIVQDLDPSSINLENPDQLLKGLMSGNLEGVENTGLKDLIGTVVSKLENKMTSGDINEEKLLSEANKMMGKFGLSKDMFENNDIDNVDLSNINDNMNNIFKNMNENSDFSSFLKNMNNSNSSINNIKNENKDNLQKRRDYLKKKLDKKKKLIEEKRIKEENTLNANNN